MNEISILIADDHPIFRGGLRNVIEKERALSIIGEAETGTEALEMIRRLAPAVAVLDLDMPEMDGFDVARELRQSNSPVVVVILSMHKDEAHFNQAIDLGVRGYVVKDSAASEIVGCIKAVAAGKEYFSPVLSSHLLNRARRATGPKRQSGTSDLTPTERRILFLLAELKTSREIAAELGVSARTIENHRANIAAKLNLSGSHAVTKFALRHRSELS